MNNTNIELTKINVSALENLELDEKITIENEEVGLDHAFTKIEILGCEYLVFGICGGFSIETIAIEELNKSGYEMFIEQINSEYDVNLQLIFDIEIVENIFENK